VAQGVGPEFKLQYWKKKKKALETRSILDFLFSDFGIFLHAQ
jgi:hypothetical protein